MTKTEFKAQPVAVLKAALLDLFEDDDGSIAEASKTSLNAFVDENWDYIDSEINAPAEMMPEVDTVPEEPAAEPEEVEEEEEMDLTRPNPRTNLHYGPLPS